MSEIVWADSWLPDSSAPDVDYESPFLAAAKEVGPVRRINAETARIPMPDPRVSRSISRAAVLMASVCLRAKPLLDAYLAANPYSVGVYVAVENGPLDYESVKALQGVPSSAFGEQYRKVRNPKMYLKQLPNLAGAQTQIFMGIRGPMCVYTHSTLAGAQALDQADSDLEAGEVEFALVATGTGFEDPVSILRAGRASGGRRLSEGACALVLKGNGKRRDWSGRELEPEKDYYGVGETIFQYARTARELSTVELIRTRLASARRGPQ